MLQQLACVFLNMDFEKLGRKLCEVLVDVCPSVRQIISRLNNKDFIESLEGKHHAALQQTGLRFLKLSGEYMEEIGGDTNKWLDIEYRD